MLVIGVDPGITGAIAFLTSDAASVLDCPTKETIVGGKRKRTQDVEAAAGMLSSWRGPYPKCVAWVEKVHAMPGQGVTSMFNFGTNYGMWLGLFAANYIPVHTVSPVKWRNAMVGKKKTKDECRMKAAELFPQLAGELIRKAHSGRADALLIAEYGRGML